MNRAQRRAQAAQDRRRCRVTAETIADLPGRLPALPIVSVDVPPAWRPHFNAALALATRLTAEELVGNEVIAAWRNHTDEQTVLTVLPTEAAIEAFRRAGEDEIADMISERLPGRHRIVMVPPSPEAPRGYGFRFGAMSPGGQA